MSQKCYWTEEKTQIYWGLGSDTILTFKIEMKINKEQWKLLEKEGEATFHYLRIRLSKYKISQHVNIYTQTYDLSHKKRKATI